MHINWKSIEICSLDRWDQNINEKHFWQRINAVFQSKNFVPLVKPIPWFEFALLPLDQDSLSSLMKLHILTYISKFYRNMSGYPSMNWSSRESESCNKTITPKYSNTFATHKCVWIIFLSQWLSIMIWFICLIRFFLCIFRTSVKRSHFRSHVKNTENSKGFKHYCIVYSSYCIHICLFLDTYELFSCIKEKSKYR